MKTMIWLKLKRLKTDYIIFLVMMVMSIFFTSIFNISGTTLSPGRIGMVAPGDLFSQEVKDTLSDQEAFTVTWFEEAQGLDALENDEIDVLYITDLTSMPTLTLKQFKRIESMEVFNAEQAFQNTLRQTLADEQMVLHVGDLLGRFTGVSLSEGQDKTKAYFAEQKRRGVALMPVQESFLKVDSVWDGYDNSLHGLIGFTAMFAMYTIVFGVGDILSDKKQHTWQRVLTSPIGKFEALLGHLSTTFAMGLIQIMTVFLVGQYVLKIDWGISNIWVLLVMTLAFCFSIIGIALILTGLVKSMNQLGAVSPILITGTAMLGGCMWPLEVVESKFLLAVSNFTPQKWFIQGVEEVLMYGKGPSEIFEPFMILMGVGCLLMAVGMLLNFRDQAIQ